MLKRQYYNVRSGAQPPRLTFEQARHLISDAYERMEEDFFQEWFGYSCVDSGDVPGKAGPKIKSFVYAATLIDGVTDIQKALATSADEVMLFTLVEFLHDHASAGIKEPGRLHDFNDCGWHYRKFDEAAGRREWRGQVGTVLANYGDGFVFSEEGEVQALGPSGLREIMRASLPGNANDTDREKVEAAVHTFRHARATRKERLGAVRELVDVLERLRPQVKEHLLTEDERALFMIANKYGIRHYNDVQKLDFSVEWLAWMFYVYLSTIHLVLRLIERKPASP